MKNRFHLEFTEAAKADVKSILKFTARKWGASQARKHKRQLDATFQTISQNPNNGLSKTFNTSDFKYMALKAGKHFIFYRLKVNTPLIYVVRILHEAMNFEDHL